MYYVIEEFLEEIGPTETNIEKIKKYFLTSINDNIHPKYKISDKKIRVFLEALNGKGIIEINKSMGVPREQVRQIIDHFIYLLKRGGTPHHKIKHINEILKESTIKTFVQILKERTL